MHRIAQRLCEPFRNQRRTTLDPVLLRTLIHSHQAFHVAVRGRIEQRMQHRHVRGVGRENRFAENLEIGAASTREKVAIDPRSERLPVEESRIRCLPRPLQIHATREFIEARHPATQIGERKGIEFRDRALRRLHRAAATEQLEHEQPVVEQRKGAEPEFLH